jgi:allantoate deiminase
VSATPRARSGADSHLGARADAATVLARCDELAAVSALPGRIDRFHLTPEHARANALVAGWMREAGMRPWQDAAGNQCGRLEGREPGLPALVIGSHLDTVADAGRYDGPLGVTIAIAVVERLRRRADPLPFAVEVLGFTDEEGARFGGALMGSRAATGTWDDAWWDQVDAQGMSVREAFTGFGLNPDRVGEAAREPGGVVGYLEAHIEQGPELEDAGRALGVVTSIAGARRFKLTVLGESRHAGGTPYPRRRDALIGASHAVIDVERIARARGVIATVGRLQAYPGAVNVVPGRVELTLDLRAEADEDRDAAWNEIRASIEATCAGRSLGLVVEETHRAPGVACAPRLRAAVEVGIAATGQPDAPALFSRAGHDGMAMAAITDIGMLFVRCHGGISHHPDEDVMPDDVAVAIDAFEAAVLEVARQG